MSELVAHMDGLSIGQNGHLQYAWTDEGWQEGIVKLSFQLVRGADIKTVTTKYRELIQRASRLPDVERAAALSLAFKMMLQTRDVVSGKGEWHLFYNMFGVWLDLEIEGLDLTQSYPYLFTSDFGHACGSWKDARQLLHKYGTTKQEMVALTRFVADRLLADDGESCTAPSLCARWAPREKNKTHQAAARAIASACFNPEGKELTDAGQRWVMTAYRKMCARLNEKLNTVQVKQCAGKWSEIDFDKDVTSVTMRRQRKAFQGENARWVNGAKGSAEAEVDRAKCTANYLRYIAECEEGTKTIKAKRNGLEAMVKDAQRIVMSGLDSQSKDKRALDLQWAAMDPNPSLANCVVLVDTSASMTWDNNPLAAAMGLGLKIAEASTLGKRIMSFASSPQWVNFDDCDGFVESVAKLVSVTAGGSTNLTKAMELLAGACVDRNMSPATVADLTFVLLSDMQIDEADRGARRCLDTDVREIFARAGIRSRYQTPYPAPHLVYWNMKSTDGFPTTSFSANATMLSGYSPALLSCLADKSRDQLTKITPFASLLEQLSVERYSWADALF